MGGWGGVGAWQHQRTPDRMWWWWGRGVFAGREEGGNEARSREGRLWDMCLDG